MARKVQCSNCKNKFDKETLIEHGSKRLCKKCLNEQKEMEDLRAYICKVYKMNYVTPKLQKQINDFVNLYNYRPKAIKMIMEYAIKIEKFEIDISLESITFVNYFKYSAIKYYTEKKAVSDSVKSYKKPEMKTANVSVTAKGVLKNKKEILNIDDL